jgi:uncharacterized protein YdaU (DUF1376 family)
MPLYCGDLTADTQDLNTLQFGAYLKLIIHYWRHGGLPGDRCTLLTISGLTPQEWRWHSDGIKRKFYITFEDAWFHKRVEAELQKADNKSKSAKARSLLGVAARQPTGQPTGQPNDEPRARASQSQSQKEPTSKDSTKLKQLSETSSDEFVKFWEAYNHKIAKPKAIKAFQKARQKTSLEVILAGVARYKASVLDSRFLAHPSTWLNAERWNDSPAPNGHAAAPKAVFGQNRLRTSTGLWVDDKFYPDQK